MHETLLDIHQNSDIAHLTQEVAQRYKVPPEETLTINRIISSIKSFARLEGISGENDSLDTITLKRLKCLDLACGNGNINGLLPELVTMMGPLKRRMEPWLCRSLHQAGVDITGVDLYYPQYEGQTGKPEEWKFVQMDLMRPEGLQRHLKDRTFDVVVSTNFVLNEHINPVAHDPVLNAPEISMLMQQNPQRYYRALRDLLSEMRRVLKSDGHALINYTKVQRPKLKTLEKALR
ncbi:MAG: methyltransferase domain-containing protein [Candidatus Peregrinibacteria bacterium]|nr:methyltransferase domain-containing protein [Candidatus Peregrinibacteria bacterium]